MGITYTLSEQGNVVVNGVEYPFPEPTHRTVGTQDVTLTEIEKQEVVAEWVTEYDRVQSENS